MCIIGGLKIKTSGNGIYHNFLKRFILFEGGKHKQEGPRERESEADLTLRPEPNAGLDLTILRSGSELKSRVRCSAS